jgi:hypothetical protein
VQNGVNIPCCLGPAIMRRGNQADFSARRVSRHDLWTLLTGPSCCALLRRLVLAMIGVLHLQTGLSNTAPEICSAGFTCREIYRLPRPWIECMNGDADASLFLEADDQHRF